MRVIAGKARRLPLVTPQGKNTRPTTDRTKETLFNVIQEEVPGSRFLDLFSGSGAIGIEALSLGAEHAVFVEFGREPVSCIKTNLAKTKLQGQATVLPIEVTYAITKLSKMGQVFDIVFADPPYKSGFEPKIAEILSHSSVVRLGSLVIFESSRETKPEYVDNTFYDIWKIKEYKTNQHIFLRVRGG